MTSEERCAWLLDKFLTTDPPRFELEFTGKDEFHLIDNQTFSKIAFGNDSCSSHYHIRGKIVFEKFDNFTKIVDVPVLMHLPETDEQFEYVVNLLNNIESIPYTNKILTYPKRLRNDKQNNSLQE